MKKLIFLILFFLGIIQGMETDPEIQRQKSKKVNQIMNYITEKISWLFGPKEIKIEQLPEEILINIILQMPGDNLNETIEAIKALAQTNMIFNRLVNDPIATNKLIQSLAEKNNKPSFIVAILIGTKAAKEWFDKNMTYENKIELINDLLKSSDNFNTFLTGIYTLKRWNLANYEQVVALSVDLTRKYDLNYSTFFKSLQEVFES
ncbi:MAG: hypothetical protein WDZ41_04630 [Candidatus Babeliales bacterium]